MKLQIESSTACNAKCTFCPRYEMTRKMGTMSDELFYKIIDQARKMGMRTFLPFLNGEPFAFPRIYEWLHYIAKNKSWIAIFTNAELMDVDKLMRYSRNIYFVNCSINAATKETYDKIMRGPDFDKVVANTRELIKRANFRVRVTMVINEENAHEVKLFKEQWGEYAKISGYANWGGVRHSKMEKKKAKKYCDRTSHTMAILWDGRVCMCCMDYDGKAIFGDLNKDTLQEVYDRMAEIRELHKKGNFKMIPCKDCNFTML